MEQEPASARDGKLPEDLLLFLDTRPLLIAQDGGEDLVVECCNIDVT
jgi:hypothetical protein